MLGVEILKMVWIGKMKFSIFKQFRKQIAPQNPSASLFQQSVMYTSDLLFLGATPIWVPF